MRLRWKISRGWTFASGLVAAFGVAAAVAISALAASPGTLTVLTLPESTYFGSEAISQTPANVDGSWVFLNSGGVDQLNSDSSLSRESIAGTGFNDSLTVVVNDGATDYVDDGIHLLKVTATGASSLSTTVLADTSVSFPSGIAVGPDGNVYVADLSDGAILECPAGGGACSTRSVPTSFSGGGAPGQPGALAVARGAVWFSANGSLGKLSSDGTFSAPYHPGEFGQGTSDLVSDGTNLWLIGSDGASLDELPAATPTAAATTFTVPVPSNIASATTPMLSSIVIGPDAKIWFTDDANNAVGFLDPATGTSTEYPFPAGDTRGDGAIGLGPAGTDSLVVSASSGASSNLLAQITSPDPIVNGPTTTFTTSTGSPGTPTPPAGGSTSTAAPAPTPTPAPTTTPANQPDTTITSGPIGDTWNETPQYAFTASIAGSTFACSVDGATPTACTSPLTLGAFAAGSTHTLSVQATGSDGTSDPTPATVTVHVNATQVASQNCAISPYNPNISSLRFACYVHLGGPAPVVNAYGNCDTTEVCTSLPQTCPALATCTLSVKTTLVTPGDEASWDVFAESEFAGTGIGSADGGNQCYPNPDSSGCTVYEVKTRFGPASLLDAACDAFYPIGSGRVGAASDHTLSCAVTLSIAPTHPLAITLLGPVIGIFAPGSGAVGVTPGGGPAQSDRTSAKRTAPLFKASTIKVASARGINFTPKLSAAAERSFRQHHKLAIRINLRFTPSGGGKAVLRTVTATLTPASKRPPSCAGHKTRKSLLSCLMKGSR